MRFPEIIEPTPMQTQVAQEIAAGPRGKVGGAFVVLLHNPVLASHLQQLGAHLRFHTAMPEDLRALAILVASAHWRCSYEWNAHARLAGSKGVLAESVIESLALGVTPQGLTPDQSTVHRFCLAMHRDGRATDGEFAAAAELLGHAGVLDLIALCGYFALLAMVLNASRHPLPAGATPRF